MDSPATYSYSYASPDEYEKVSTSYAAGDDETNYSRRVSGTNDIYGEAFSGFYYARHDANGYFTN